MTDTAPAPLTDEAPTGAWVVGHNMPGYLPESDTYAAASWHDAWAVFRGDLDRYAEEDDNAWRENPCGHGADGYGGDECDSECYGGTAALVDSVLADGEREGLFTEDQDVTVSVVDNDDRPMIFFLAWSPDSTPDED